VIRVVVVDVAGLIASWHGFSRATVRGVTVESSLESGHA